MKITMYGAGYVGLVTGTCFAEMGNQVVCVDIDSEKIARLNAAEVPIHEPGLTSLLQSNLQSGRLTFSTDLEFAAEHGDVLFVAVGTPEDARGSAELRFVLNVAESIGYCMRERKLVVMKSTVPVGTADRVREVIAKCLTQRQADIEFDVVSNPEFLKEGAAVGDFMKPDRIIVGADNLASSELLEQLYAPFNRNRDKVIRMDVRSAELTKYAANVMLATRISLMNEFANIAERVGADIESTRRGIGADPRIGYDFIYPGTGYGGSCFPKDVRALIRTAGDAGHRAYIAEAVESVNEQQKSILYEKVLTYYANDIRNKTFAVWGLAFKPNTNDVRSAPSITVIRKLLLAGARVQAYDPVAVAEVRAHCPGLDEVTLCSSAMSTLEQADGLIIATEWNEFRSPDFQQMGAVMNEKVIFDGRNLYSPQEVGSHGFHYFSIGRKAC